MNEKDDNLFAVAASSLRSNNLVHSELCAVFSNMAELMNRKSSNFLILADSILIYQSIVGLGSGPLEYKGILEECKGVLKSNDERIQWVPRDKLDVPSHANSGDEACN